MRNTTMFRPNPVAKGIDVILRFGAQALLGIGVVFILGPGLLVVVLSFSTADFIEFPPTEFGFDQYASFFSSRTWLAAFWLSVWLGIASAAVTLLVSVPAVLVVFRSTARGRSLLLVGGVASLLIPISAYAVGLYWLYSKLGLLGTYQGIIIAHSLLAIPLVLLIVGAAVVRIPRELELVAMSLGASRLRATTGITLRLLAPALLTTGMLAFLTSFDEAVLISFLGGSGLVTLPKAIFDSVRYGIDPSITAVAGTLIAFSAILMILQNLLERKTSR